MAKNLATVNISKGYYRCPTCQRIMHIYNDPYAEFPVDNGHAESDSPELVATILKGVPSLGCDCEECYQKAFKVYFKSKVEPTIKGSTVAEDKDVKS